MARVRKTFTLRSMKSGVERAARGGGDESVGLSFASVSPHTNTDLLKPSPTTLTRRTALKRGELQTMYGRYRCDAHEVSQLSQIEEARCPALTVSQ